MASEHENLREALVHSLPEVDLPDTCIQAALTAYENARIDGLCHEGAWECAVAALAAELQKEARHA